MSCEFYCPGRSFSKVLLSKENINRTSNYTSYFKISTLFFLVSMKKAKLQSKLNYFVGGSVSNLMKMSHVVAINGLNCSILFHDS